MVQKKEDAKKDVLEELAGIQSYMSSVWVFLLTRGDADSTVVRKKNSDSCCSMEEMQQTCQRCGLTRLFSLEADGFRAAS